MNVESPTPSIIDRSVAFETPWFQLIAKTVVHLPGSAHEQVFFALKPDDYVSVVALTEEDKVVLVRQFRPVVEAYTVELPSGHVESGQTPEQAARQELLEETGYRAEDFELLGVLLPDSGRLDNRQWCFFARECALAPGPIAVEEGIETLAMDLDDLIVSLEQGTFNHALHLAALMLASLKGKLNIDTIRREGRRAGHPQ